MPLNKKGAAPVNGAVAEKPAVEAENPNKQKVDTDYYVRYNKPMSQYEIDLDRKIRLSGVYQAAAQSPALATMPWKKQEDLHDAVDKLAKFILSKIEA